LRDESIMQPMYLSIKFDFELRAAAIAE
jgi:hypothetical protein